MANRRHRQRGVAKTTTPSRPSLDWAGETSNLNRATNRKKMYLPQSDSCGIISRITPIDQLCHRCYTAKTGNALEALLRRHRRATKSLARLPLMSRSWLRPSDHLTPTRPSSSGTDSPLQDELPRQLALQTLHSPSWWSHRLLDQPKEHLHTRARVA